MEPWGHFRHIITHNESNHGLHMPPFEYAPEYVTYMYIDEYVVDKYKLKNSS